LRTPSTVTTFISYVLIYLNVCIYLLLVLLLLSSFCLSGFLFQLPHGAPSLLKEKLWGYFLDQLFYMPKMHFLWLNQHCQSHSTKDNKCIKHTCMLQKYHGLSHEGQGLTWYRLIKQKPTVAILLLLASTTRSA